MKIGEPTASAEAKQERWEPKLVVVKATPAWNRLLQRLNNLEE